MQASAITVRNFYDALSLARSATSDPINAPRYNSQLLSKLTAIEPSFGRNPPVSRVVTPATVQSVLISAAATPVVTPTADIPITWPRMGRVLGVVATILEGDPKGYSRVSMTLKVNGDVNLVVQGLGEGSVPLSVLQNGRLDQPQGWFPLNWPVNTTDRWFVKFTSDMIYNPDLAALRYTPKIAFLFEEEGVSE